MIYLFKENSHEIERKLFKDGKLYIEDLYTFGDKTRDIVGHDTSSVVDYIRLEYKKRKTPYAIFIEELPLVISRWALNARANELSNNLLSDEEESSKKMKRITPQEKLKEQLRTKSATILNLKLTAPHT